MASRLITWLAAMLLVPSVATSECRQALMLALDVSGSVDKREYRLQLDGLANALLDPQVMAAFDAMPGAPVRLSVMEWSGEAFQRTLVPWTEVDSRAALPAIATTLRRTARVEADLSTAIGSALLRAGAEVQAQGDCWRQVIDLSGDGISNGGPLPGSIRAPLDGITVNGLVIGGAGSRDAATETDALVAYYRAYVLRGVDAFIETAAGFDDFEAAMVRKLLRELQVVTMSDVPGETTSIAHETEHTAPHRTAPHRTAPHRTAPHRTAPHRTAPHRTAP